MSLNAKIRKYSDYRIEYNQIKAVVKKKTVMFSERHIGDITCNALHTTNARQAFICIFI